MPPAIPILQNPVISHCSCPKTVEGNKDREKQEAFCALFILARRQSQYVSAEKFYDPRVLPLPIKRKALNHYLRCLFFLMISLTRKIAQSFKYLRHLPLTLNPLQDWIQMYEGRMCLLYMSGQRKVSGAFIVMSVPRNMSQVCPLATFKQARYVAALTQSLAFLSLYVWFKF